MFMYYSKLIKILWKSIKMIQSLKIPGSGISRGKEPLSNVI